jgi:hypothetical protein
MDSETQPGDLVLEDISGNTCRMEQPPRRATHASATSDTRQPPRDHRALRLTQRPRRPWVVTAGADWDPHQVEGPLNVPPQWFARSSGADASARAVTSASVMKDADEDIARAPALSGAVDHRWAR